MRIVSLLPSATEIVFALGRGDDLVGVTFECDHPPAARQVRVVSTSALPEGLSPAEIDAVVSARIAAGEDLYRLDEQALAGLDPDVVLTQDLCAVCAVAVDDVDAALAHLGCSAEVVTLDPPDLAGVLATVTEVGRALDCEARAAELVADAERRLAAVREAVEGRTPVRVLVLEWTDPAFCAGHWVPDLVTAAGGCALLAQPGTDSRRVGWDEVRDADADVVLVAPCGYHLDAAAAMAGELVAADRLPPAAAVWAIDADGLVVRPGPRLVDGVEAIARILHPEPLGEPDPGATRRVR